MANQTVTRVGVAVLNSDMSLEPDLAGALAGSLPVHVARIDYPGKVTTDSLAQARDASRHAMRQLVHAAPDLLIYACTSGSFFDGLEGNAAYRDSARREFGVPVVTATDAVLHSLRRLGARRIGLVTPYDESVTARLIGLLAAAGVDVSATSLLFGNLVVDDLILQTVPHDTLVAHCRAVSDGVDAVLVSCTGIRALDVIGKLERAARVPVVTSNLSIVRLILDAARGAQANGDGRLLRLARTAIEPQNGEPHE